MATKFEGLEKKRRIIRTVWVNSTGYLLQLCKIGIISSIFLPSLHPTCFWCWTIPNHVLKKYKYCGNHGKHNKSMVPCISQIMGKNKTFSLNQKLTCANYGIYVATCVICHEQYVEQTNNKFCTRWSSPQVIGTDPIVKLMKIIKIKWPCCGTFQSPTATWTNRLCT